MVSDFSICAVVI